MIDFSVCANCGLPIFFDWRGTHHVNPESYGPLGLLQFDPAAKPCEKPEEGSKEVWPEISDVCPECGRKQISGNDHIGNYPHAKD